MRRSPAQQPLERVKIFRLGWSLSAAVILMAASAGTARAQEPRADTTATHTVKRGDTLWDLAASYLGDAYLWPEIYRLNTDQIEDPHWIFPDQVLRLPGRAPVVAQTPTGPVPLAGPGRGAPPAREEQQPRRSTGPTVFTPRKLVAPRSALAVYTPPARVPFDDVIRAPYFDRVGGPRGAGKVLFDTDIPGIAREHNTTNFQLFKKLLLTPPEGSRGAERERYVAYQLGDLVDDVGTEVIPVAVLEVIRPSRTGEAATVRVVSLYGRLDADTRVVPVDTAGAGATAKPAPVPAATARTAKVRAIHRQAVLPSLGYFVLFDLAAKDGMRIGDEIEIYHPRSEQGSNDGPAVPEVKIATGQVVRVTEYGATARVTAQEQPAIRIGESVRVTARMP
jgi:hypothetical protein